MENPASVRNLTYSSNLPEFVPTTTELATEIQHSRNPTVASQLAYRPNAAEFIPSTPVRAPEYHETMQPTTASANNTKGRYCARSRLLFQIGASDVEEELELVEEVENALICSEKAPLGGAIQQPYMPLTRLLTQQFAPRRQTFSHSPNSTTSNPVVPYDVDAITFMRRTMSEPAVAALTSSMSSSPLLPSAYSITPPEQYESPADVATSGHVPPPRADYNISLEECTDVVKPAKRKRTETNPWGYIKGLRGHAVYISAEAWAKPSGKAWGDDSTSECPEGWPSTWRLQDRPKQIQNPVTKEQATYPFGPYPHSLAPGLPLPPGRRCGKPKRPWWIHCAFDGSDAPDLNLASCREVLFRQQQKVREAEEKERDRLVESFKSSVRAWHQQWEDLLAFERSGRVYGRKTTCAECGSTYHVRSMHDGPDYEFLSQMLFDSQRMMTYKESCKRQLAARKATAKYAIKMRQIIRSPEECQESRIYEVAAAFKESPKLPVGIHRAKMFDNGKFIRVMIPPTPKDLSQLHSHSAQIQDVVRRAGHRIAGKSYGSTIEFFSLDPQQDPLQLADPCNLCCTEIKMTRPPVMQPARWA